MTLKQIIDDIALKTNAKKSDVRDIIEYYHNAIIDEIVAAGCYSIRNFGKFTCSEHKAKEGRNPKTGEKITIPAHKLVKFTAAKYLKDNIQ